MLADILKDKRFNYFFSFILGLFVAVLISPCCKEGEACILFKAPPMHELRTNSYRINKKCFRFHAIEKECPDAGVIEPFEWSSLQTR
jgi:hypothetical protein